MRKSTLLFEETKIKSFPKLGSNLWPEKIPCESFLKGIYLKTSEERKEWNTRFLMSLKGTYVSLFSNNILMSKSRIEAQW